MSASTQGTPHWLMRLEQAKDQLKTENYITWLLTKAEEHGIPDEVIKAQLQHCGYVEVSKEEAETLAPRKAGRPPLKKEK